MKKLISIAFLAIITGNVAGQNNADSINIEKETEITAAEESTSNNNVLTDFLAYVVNKQHQQNQQKKDRQSGWHTEPYFGYGFIVGDIENNRAKLLYGNSYSIDFGIKSRYQFNPVYSFTFNAGWLHNRYKISDGIVNGFLGNSFTLIDPSNYTVGNERFRTWALHLSFGNRFNFDKNRKFDDIGKYIEISAYGNYAYSRKYLLTMQGNSNVEADLSYKAPALFNPFEAGVQVNLGFEHFSIWGRYRLTDWFDSNDTKTKLPPFVVGVAVNF